MSKQTTSIEYERLEDNICFETETKQSSRSFMMHNLLELSRLVSRDKEKFAELQTKAKSKSYGYTEDEELYYKCAQIISLLLNRTHNIQYKATVNKNIKDAYQESCLKDEKDMEEVEYQFSGGYNGY